MMLREAGLLMLWFLGVFLLFGLVLNFVRWVDRGGKR